MPAKLTDRSTMTSPFLPPQGRVDGHGGALAVLDRFHRQILAARDAIAAGPDVRQRGLEFLIDLDAAVLQLQRVGAERAGDEALADGLEHHVRGEREFFAGADQLAAVEPRVFELRGDDMAVAGEKM